MIHKTYVPFTIDELKTHFVKSRKEEDNIEKHISRYLKSVKNYEKYEKGLSENGESKKTRQIEKDETFWTASTLMTVFHSSKRNAELKRLLIESYGEKPPLSNFSSWDECLEGDLKLFFEPNIPSPKKYKSWLRDNVTNQNFIPYILDQSKNKQGDYRSNLEGATNVDAIVINSGNGFSIFIEAKVLSDISYQVSYDSTRNQIIRNIDVMMSPNPELEEPLCNRIPDNTLFLLLTPKMYRDNPTTRLYGYKFNDYKKHPESISRDMKHRDLSLNESVEISKRIGWATWEDLKRINNNCCKWMKITAHNNV